MASHRPKVPEITKKALRDEAGDKCANPGCPSDRPHLHHIREWAVYQSHDGHHMIAICPTCHDAVHRGRPEITDETLYRWKTIIRDKSRRGHIYVEPAREAKLLMGSIAVTGDAGLIVFELSRGNRMSFALEDNEIMLLSLSITNRRRREVVKLVESHVTVDAEEEIEYEKVPGRHKITAPLNPRYLPKWALSRIQASEPGYRPGERVTMLDLEVLEPGIVRVEGAWLENHRGVVVTPDGVHFVRVDPLEDRSIFFQGQGVNSVLHWKGPITEAAFRV